MIYVISTSHSTFPTYEPLPFPWPLPHFFLLSPMSYSNKWPLDSDSSFTEETAIHLIPLQKTASLIIAQFIRKVTSSPTRRRIIQFRVLASNELSPIESESGPSCLQGFQNNFLCLMSLSRKFVTTSLVRFLEQNIYFSSKSVICIILSEGNGSYFLSYW